MRRILLDTDLAMGAPGSDVDDGFALALALADPDLSVELVSTVHGNTDVDTATGLAVALLERLGRAEVPVVRGAAVPLVPGTRRRSPAERRRAPGATGTRARAATEIADRVMAASVPLTVVALGPLTNVALALLLEPEVATAVEEVVVMGGVFLGHTGRSTRPGEFNVWSDPDAAAVVLASGAPLRFVGLDVTRQVRLTRGHAAALAAGGGGFGGFAGECAQAWIDHQERTNPGDAAEHGSCALHDPLAVAVVTRPELVTWRPSYVAVETSSEVTRGVMIADLLTSEHPPPPNCQIATGVDVEAFTALFLSRLAGL